MNRRRRCGIANGQRAACVSAWSCRRWQRQLRCRTHALATARQPSDDRDEVAEEEATAEQGAAAVEAAAVEAAASATTSAAAASVPAAVDVPPMAPGVDTGAVVVEEGCSAHTHPRVVLASMRLELGEAHVARAAAEKRAAAAEARAEAAVAAARSDANRWHAAAQDGWRRAAWLGDVMTFVAPAGSPPLPKAWVTAGYAHGYATPRRGGAGPTSFARARAATTALGGPPPPAGRRPGVRRQLVR